MDINSKCEILREFGEILGKYRILDAIPVVSKGRHGTLDWGSPCLMANLRNGIVPCHYRVPIWPLPSHVIFNLRNTTCCVTYCIVMSLGLMLHVGFRNRPCWCIEFKQLLQEIYKWRIALIYFVERRNTSLEYILYIMAYNVCQVGTSYNFEESFCICFPLR